MTEAELRALVRDAIAHHLGGLHPGGQGAGESGLIARSAHASHGGVAALLPNAATGRGHASHLMFVLPAGDSACLIEPAVACTHCGYCKSYGH